MNQTSMCLDTLRSGVKLVPLGMFWTSSIFTDCSKAVLLLWIHDFLFVSHFCLYCAVLVVLWGLVVACWTLRSLVGDVFFFVFVTFPFGVSGQLRYLILLIPYLCLLPYFVKHKLRNYPRRTI